MIEFEKDGKKYVYEFNELTVEQAEYAREAGEFKLQQMESQPDSFDLVIRSRGAEYLPIIASYLIVEKKGDEKPVFSLEKVRDTEKFIKSLPVVEIKKIREVVLDFFQGIGLSQSGLALQQGWQRKKESEMFMTLLENLTNRENELGGLLNTRTGSEDASMQASLIEELPKEDTTSGMSALLRMEM